MQHRREENEVLATDQRYLNVVAAGQRFVQVHRRAQSGESASGNDNYRSSSFVLRTRYWSLHLCETAIYKQFGSGNVTAVAGCEKHDSLSDLIGCAEPT